VPELRIDDVGGCEGDAEGNRSLSGCSGALERIDDVIGITLPEMRRDRYLQPTVERVLSAGKMAFIGGPRQVGKTTLALRMLSPRANEKHPAYLSWDDPRAAAHGPQGYAHDRR
jgi:hypothetical protein